MSATTLPAPVAVLGARPDIASTAPADSANVTASNANADPTPTAWISTPPRAGPARRCASGRTS